MRAFTFILLLAAMAISCAEPKTMYVSAADSLYVRSQPGLHGSVITALPRGTKVQVFEEADEQVSINGISGKWMRISDEGAEHWVFGAYLSQNSPPPLPKIPPKPKLPIEITYRHSHLGEGYVVNFYNPTRKYIQVKATFENPTFSEKKTTILSISPRSQIEYGWMEGWKFSSGEFITLEHADYLPLKTKLP